MREPKEKPAWPKRSKPGRGRNNHTVSREVGKPLKNYAQQKLARNRRDQEPNAAVKAEEQVERYTAGTLSTAGRGLAMASRLIRGLPQARRTGPRSKQQGPAPHSSPMEHERPGPDMEAAPAASDLISSHPVIPKERQTTLKEKDPQDIRSRAASASELSAVSKENRAGAAQLQPPPTGERMKQAAARKRQAEAVRGEGGRRSAPPLLSEHVDGMADSQEGLPLPPGRIARHPQAATARRGQGLSAPDSRKPSAAPPTDQKSGLSIVERDSVSRKEWSRQPLPSIKARSGTRGDRTHPVKAKPTPRAPGTARAAALAAAQKAAGRTVQNRARQLAIVRTKQTAKTTASLGKKAVQTVAHAVASLVSVLVDMVGRAVLLVVLCVVLFVAAVIASPFGIFFASQQQEPGTVPPNGAIAQVNIDLADYLADLQAGGYADIQLDGQLPDWREVLAVFAVRTTLGEDGVDVLTMDPDRVERLKEVFGDMTAIIAEPEGTENGVILYLTVEAKTTGEMGELYGFTDE